MGLGPPPPRVWAPGKADFGPTRAPMLVPAASRLGCLVSCSPADLERTDRLCGCAGQTRYCAFNAPLWAGRTPVWLWPRRRCWSLWLTRGDTPAPGPKPYGQACLLWYGWGVRAASLPFLLGSRPLGARPILCVILCLAASTRCCGFFLLAGGTTAGAARSPLGQGMADPSSPAQSNVTSAGLSLTSWATPAR